MQIYNSSIKYSQINNSSSNNKPVNNFIATQSQRKLLEPLENNTVKKKESSGVVVAAADVAFNSEKKYKGAASQVLMNTQVMKESQSQRKQIFLGHISSIREDMSQEQNQSRMHDPQSISQPQLQLQNRKNDLEIQVPIYINQRKELINKQQQHQQYQINQAKSGVHQSPQKNTTLWEGIKAHTIGRIKLQLDNKYNNNQSQSQQSLNDQDEQQQQLRSNNCFNLLQNSIVNNDISQSSQKILYFDHTPAAAGVGAVSEREKKRYHLQNVLPLDSYSSNCNPTRDAIIINDSSNPKLNNNQELAYKKSISQSSIGRKLASIKPQAQSHPQNSRIQLGIKPDYQPMNEFVDMQLQIKPLKIFGDQSDKKPPVSGVACNQAKNQSTLGAIKLVEMPSQLENSIIKFPKITGGISSLSNCHSNKSNHNKEDSLITNPQNEYVVLQPSQPQPQAVFENDMTMMSQNSMISDKNYLLEMYKGFPQRISITSMARLQGQKLYNQVLPTGNDAIFPIKPQVAINNLRQHQRPDQSKDDKGTLMIQLPENRKENQDLEPLQLKRKGFNKLPIESQKEAARRFVKKIAKKKLMQPQTLQTPSQAQIADASTTSLDRMNYLSNQHLLGGGGKLITKQNQTPIGKRCLLPITLNSSLHLIDQHEIRLLGGHPSHIILSIVNPLPPGTADTTTTSKLFRQDTLGLNGTNETTSSLSPRSLNHNFIKNNLNDSINKKASELHIKHSPTKITHLQLVPNLHDSFSKGVKSPNKLMKKTLQGKQESNNLTKPLLLKSSIPKLSSTISPQKQQLRNNDELTNNETNSHFQVSRGGGEGSGAFLDETSYNRGGVSAWDTRYHLKQQSVLKGKKARKILQNHQVDSKSITNNIKYDQQSVSNMMEETNNNASWINSKENTMRQMEGEEQQILSFQEVDNQVEESENQEQDNEQVVENEEIIESYR